MNQGSARIIRPIFLIFSLLVVYFITSIGITALTPSNFGFNEASDNITKSGSIIIGSLTILGVIASIFVSALRAQPQNEPARLASLFSAVLYPQTFIALCVSPVILFGVLVSLGAKELGPSVYLAAFQNGFFWQRLLDGKS